MRIVWIALLAAAVVTAQNKDHVAIQRDISLLGDEVKKLQGGVNDQMIAVKTMLQQVINTSDRTNTATVALEAKLTERLMSLEKSLTTSVATLGAKVDTMADEFRGVKEDVRDVNSKMSKLQAQMNDMLTAVKTLKEAPPPPGSGPQAQQPVPAEKLFAGAERDNTGGNYDLALQGYQEFLKVYASSELACVAQFQIAEIYRKKNETLETTMVAYDTVLEKYDSTCARRPDAMYMKARLFTKAGSKTEAIKVYRKLYAEFPGTDWSRKAEAGARELGLPIAAPGAAAKKRPK
jgi:TolA-binding protein